MSWPRSLASLWLLVPLALSGCAGGTPAPTPALEVDLPDGSRAVFFRTQDGLTLVGQRYGNGKVGIVLAHMFPADQTSWQPFAQAMAKRGYTALTFNFRGYPPSQGGKEIEKIDRDVKAALEYLRAQGIEKAFLVGASMGGTASLKVAAQVPVAGVVALSAPTQFMGLRALEDARRVNAPVLLIASENDETAQKSAGLLYEEVSGPKVLTVLQGALHGTDILRGPRASFVEESVLRFLEAYSQ